MPGVLVPQQVPGPTSAGHVSSYSRLVYSDPAPVATHVLKVLCLDGHCVLFPPVNGQGPAVPAGWYRPPLAGGLTGLTGVQGRDGGHSDPPGNLN